MDVEYIWRVVKWISNHPSRPALLEHMPLIEAHPHTLEDQYGEGQDDLNLLTDTVSKTNTLNSQMEKPAEVNGQLD